MPSHKKTATATTPTPLTMRRAMSLPKLRHGAIIALPAQHEVYEYRKDDTDDDTDGVLVTMRFDEVEINLDTPPGAGLPVDMITPSSFRESGERTLYFADMEYFGFAYHMYSLDGQYLNTAICYDDVHFLAEMARTKDEDYDYIRVATLAPGSRFPAALNLRDTLTPELLEELLKEAPQTA